MHAHKFCCLIHWCCLSLSLPHSTSVSVTSRRFLARVCSQDCARSLISADQTSTDSLIVSKKNTSCSPKLVGSLNLKQYCFLFYFLFFRCVLLWSTWYDKECWGCLCCHQQIRGPCLLPPLRELLNLPNQAFFISMDKIFGTIFLLGHIRIVRTLSFYV